MALTYERIVSVSKRKYFALGCFLLLVSFVIWFGDTPSFLKKTRQVVLHPKTASGIEVGVRVKRGGMDIGYVKDINLSIDGEITIELRIYEGMPLRKTDVCVIHRLHRYDTATLHIEMRAGPGNLSEIADKPFEMTCVFANGPWPELPGFYEQRAN